MSQAAAFFALENLLTYQNVLVIIAAWFAVTTLRKMFPRFFVERWGSRILPVLPAIVCQILVWATVQWQPEASAGERVLLGLVLGAFTANAHSILRRFGLQELIPGLREGEKGFPKWEAVPAPNAVEDCERLYDGKD